MRICAPTNINILIHEIINSTYLMHLPIIYRFHIFLQWNTVYHLHLINSTIYNSFNYVRKFRKGLNGLQWIDNKLVRIINLSTGYQLLL